MTFKILPKLIIAMVKQANEILSHHRNDLTCAKLWVEKLFCIIKVEPKKFINSKI